MPRGIPNSPKKQRKQTLKRKLQPLLVSGTNPVLGLLVRSVIEFYQNDPSVPGVVISWLPGMRMYYVSITRYKGGFGTVPQAICNAKSESLLEALNSIVEQWRNKITPSNNATEAFLKAGV